MSTTNAGTAIQLIAVTKSDKEDDEDADQWSVPEEAKNFLGQLKGPIVIVVFCGDCRQGKSYAAGRCVNDLSQFAFSDSTAAKTKGIRMSTKPIPGTNIYVIDTEGLNDTQSTLTLNAYIMSLAILFADKVIFNFKHSLTQDSIDRFGAGIETVKTLLAQQTNHGSENILTKSRPELVWLLRDKTLDFRDRDDKQLNHQEYLEYSLSGSRTGLALRAQIEKLFSRNDLYSLPLPTTNIQDLVAMQNTTSAFENGLIGFISFLKRTPPKLIDGTPMTGSVLLTMAETFCSILSRNEIPQLLTVAENIRRLRVEESMRHHLEEFQFNLTEACPSKPQVVFYDFRTVSNELTAMVNQAKSEPIFQEEPTAMGLLVEKALHWTRTSSDRKAVQWHTNLEETSGNTEKLMELVPDDLKSHIQKLGDQITVFEQALTSMTCERDELQRTLEYCQSLQQVNPTTDLELGNESQMEELRTQNEQLNIEVQGLRMIEEKFRASINNSIAKMKEELASQHETLLASQTSERKLESELKTAQEKCNELVTRISSLESDKRTLETSLANMTKDNSFVKRQRDTTQAVLVHAQQGLEQCKRAKTDLASKNAELKKELADMSLRNRTLELLQVLK